jgi:GT2 family glycosyltransferase
MPEGSSEFADAAGPLASIVISTYNRAEALPATLAALAVQDIPPERYEVLVVDDGSTDRTNVVLEAATTPYRLRLFREPVNRGVSAGRNIGLRAAGGRYLIMISDDLLVPPDFIRVHAETHRRFGNAWVVGGFRQLDDLTVTPFGRYLDRLEQSFEGARTGALLEDDLYEMSVPTARNLSLPREHLESIGVFDEQFRVTCEDQDLAERAKLHGVRFIYNGALECIHNDMAADLARYCRFQERGARDTVRFCGKYPEIHGDAAVLRLNEHIGRGDGVPLTARKLLKSLLSLPSVTRGLEAAIATAERRGLPDVVLFRAYSLLIGAYTFRGIRGGLREQYGRPAR